MNIINLTPHPLNIYNEDGEHVVTVPLSGKVARVKIGRRLTSKQDGVPLFATEVGKCDELPSATPDTIFVVSGFVRTAMAHRADVFQPGVLLKNEHDKVIGCVGLSR